jgi:iron complex outermembrane receptor protein
MQATKRILLSQILVVSFLSTASFSQTDSVRVYWLSPIEVTANRVFLGQGSSPTTKDNLATVFSQNGFALIRKGTFFAQDVYADGFKRGDLSVVIDGERFYNSCPNRMDSPLTRINPLEMATVDMVKTSSAIQSGLGGTVNFHRTVPEDPPRLTAAASGSSGASESFDLTGLIEGSEHRITLRHSAGIPHLDAEGRDFKTLYGYRENFRYSLTEGAFQGRGGDLRYGGGYTYTQNVSFAYLLMDEIYNKAVNAFVSYAGHKLYFNYTDHLMDNSLRLSMGRMTTHAYNATAGLVGDFYEVTYRYWDANNAIVTPMTRIQNQLMPGVNVFSAKAQETFQLSPLTIRARLGLQYNTVGERSRLDFHRTLYPGADPTRWFFLFSALVQSQTSFGKDWALAGLLDVTTNPPQTEYLYVGVRKPMGKPWWAGNPSLRQPVRTTLRTSLNYGRFAQLELYGSYVWDYVYLTDRSVGMTQYVTYRNIDALLLGLNLSAEWEHAALKLFYTWAQNQETRSPLSEIYPLRLEGTLTTPAFYGFSALGRVTYHARQGRVDMDLDETPTPSWVKIDLGVDYRLESLLFLFEVDNLTNELYTQHLSYMRNPFSSGARVIEPGRFFRFSIRYFGEF